MTYHRTDGRTHPLVETRERILNAWWSSPQFSLFFASFTPSLPFLFLLIFSRLTILDSAFYTKFDSCSGSCGSDTSFRAELAGALRLDFLCFALFIGICCMQNYLCVKEDSKDVSRYIKGTAKQSKDDTTPLASTRPAFIFPLAHCSFFLFSLSFAYFCPHYLRSSFFISCWRVIGSQLWSLKFFQERGAWNSSVRSFS